VVNRFSERSSEGVLVESYGRSWFTGQKPKVILSCWMASVRLMRDYNWKINPCLRDFVAVGYLSTESSSAQSNKIELDPNNFWLSRRGREHDFLDMSRSRDQNFVVKRPAE